MDVKKDFPVLKRKVKGNKLTYLDTAATSLTPQRVIDKLRHYYENVNANVHRGMHEMSEEATVAYREAHEKVGDLINASWKEIIFTKNCTEALNMAAAGLSQYLGPGDNVVVTEMEHHSNFAPWQRLAKTKAFELRISPVTSEGKLDMDSFKELVDSNTAVVSTVHASNFLGTINPVKEMAEIAHDNDACFVLDSAQAVPHMGFDVEKTGADLIAFSGHKMLGPTGTGVLWGKKEVLEDIEPSFLGGGMVREVSYEESKYEELPWKLEAGTPNIAGGIALGAAADYLKSVGMEKIEKHDKKLVEECMEMLEEIGATIYGPKHPRTGLVSFNLDGLHSHDVSTVLDEQGVAIRGGHHCVMPLHKKWGLAGSCRASFYLYNDENDVEALKKGLLKAREVLG